MNKDKDKRVEPEDLDQDTGETGALNEEELDSISGGTIDGISRLINVAQMKSSNANDEALTPKRNVRFKKP